MRTTKTAKKDCVYDAKMKIVLRFPFFANLLLRHDIVATQAIPTACVDKNGHIYYNPDFFSTMNVEQTMFILAHEVMHVVYAHLARRGDRDPGLWNIATDAVINYFLKKASCGDMPDGCVYMDDVTDDTTAEQLYEALKKHADQVPQPPTIGDLQEGLDGGGDDQSGGKDGKDGKPSKGGMTKSEIAEAIAKGKQELAQAATVARMRGGKEAGNGGGYLSVIDAYLESKVQWYEKLHQYMQGKVSAGLNWSRPNKRFRSVYMPSRGSLPGMGKVCVGIDTSGSISDDDIAGYFGHLNAIAELCNPESIDVLYVTSRIERHDHFDKCDYPLEPGKNRWCGGTDMRAITHWVDEQDDDYDCVVIFTDGYTPTPESCKSDVVWVITSEHCRCDGFIGEVLRI